MNEARVVGKIETFPERWFVNGEAVLRTHVRVVLPELDYFPDVLKRIVVVEVLAREGAAIQLWQAQPRARVWVSGRLSFIDQASARGPEPSTVLVDTTEGGCLAEDDTRPDLARLILSGTVRDQASELRPHQELRSYFLLANRVALGSPFPNPEASAIFTLLGLTLREKTGGIELGEQVTLSGDLVTRNDTIGHDGSTTIFFLATDLLVNEERLDDCRMLSPPSFHVASIASGLPIQ